MTKEFIMYDDLNDEQRALVDSKSDRVRYDAVSMGFGLDKLVYDENLWVRTQIAKMGYGLDLLVKDNHWLVQEYVAQQGYGLDKLIGEDDVDVRNAVKKYLRDNGYNNIEDWIAKNPDRCVLNQNKYIATFNHKNGRVMELDQSNDVDKLKTKVYEIILDNFNKKENHFNLDKISSIEIKNENDGNNITININDINQNLKIAKKYLNEDFLNNSYTEEINQILNEMINDKKSQTVIMDMIDLASLKFYEIFEETDVEIALKNRQHTHHGAYQDIGAVLDNYSTQELIDYFKIENESILRNYIEEQIISDEINKARHLSTARGFEDEWTISWVKKFDVNEELDDEEIEDDELEL